MTNEVIDFHCHPFLIPSEDICIYPDGSPASPEGFLADITRAGIGRFCGSVVSRIGHCDTFEPIHTLNMHALELGRRFGGRYIPGIHVHPSFPAESEREIREMAARGVKLVGELVPYMLGWEVGYGAPVSVELWRLCGELGMTVSAHPTDAADMEAAVAACPETNFVFAHPGERGEFESHLDRMKKYKNSYLDLCGTGLFRFGMVRHGINAVGADRFLLGTDFPICSASMQITGVTGEHITDSEADAILYGNAARLLSL
ncbi:MAG: amidohydrolase family protein [Eubacteriales bacterium]